MRPFCTWLLAAAAAVLPWINLPAQQDDPAPPPIVESSPQEAGVRFFSQQTLLEPGKTALVPFSVRKTDSENWRRFSATSSSNETLEIIRPPEIGPDRQVGYVRVRAPLPSPRAWKQPTVARLSIGSAQIRVDIAPQRESAPLPKPQILTPASGAVLWPTGEDSPTSLLVEIPPAPFSSLNPEQLRAGLLLPDGRELEPVSAVRAEGEPVQRFLFELSPAQLPAGTHALTPVAYGPNGWAAYGEPVILYQLAQPPDDFISGEAEDITIPAGKRPERAGNRQPNNVADPTASGGRHVRMSSGRPYWCLPVKVETPAFYQARARVRGNHAGGTFPSLALFINDEREALTAGQTASGNWHWVSVGRPFLLPAGEHILNFAFANDFYAHRLADRNLEFDAFEIARCGIPGGNPGSDSNNSAMMGAMGAPSMTMMSMMGEASKPMLNDNGNTSDMPGLGGPYGLSLTLDSPVEGREVTGSFVIQAQCEWEKSAHEDTPEVTLIINGEPFAIQQTGKPRFQIPRNALRKGTNVIQLSAAFDEGPAVRTPPQRVIAHGPDPETPATPPLRIAAADESWTPESRKHLEEFKGYPARVLSLYSNSTISLSLPEELSGPQRLFVHGMGRGYKGLPKVTVEVKANGTAHKLDPLHMRWRGRFEAGTLDLPPGPKTLSLSFINDRYEPGKGDRNVHIAAVELLPADAADDTQPPEVEILYPAPGQPVYEADAVVARVYDDHHIASAELLINGEPSGIGWEPPNGLGPAYLPYPANTLDPGTAQLSVRVTDSAGNKRTSAPVEVDILATVPASPTAYARAVHILNRFAFGPEDTLMAAILADGHRAWLARQLNLPFDAPGETVALAETMARYPDEGNQYQVKARTLRHLLQTDNPARARFVLWAQNHFSTWIRKAGAYEKWHEHRAFSEAGVAPFRDLLWTSATAPAMLKYLDQDRSYYGSLNENYAREILELHTHGVENGYTQKDVTTLARVLNGWTFSEEAHPDGRGGRQKSQTFRFDPALSGGEPAELLGLRLEAAPPAERYDRVLLVLEALAASPHTARHVSRRLAEHYVAAPAPDALVGDLAAVYLATGGDMRQLLYTIADHPAFYETRNQRLATPLDYVTRLLRIARHQDHGRALRHTDASGFGIFERPTPDGYAAEDDAYASSNAMLQRWQLARDLAYPLLDVLPPEWRRQLPEGVDDRLLVDFLALRIHGSPLSDSSRKAALTFLKQDDASGRERTLNTIAFVTMLPEFNLK